MTKKRKGMVAAAAAFAASPAGRRLLQQAKEYASRPENQEKAKQLVAQARAKVAARKGSSGKASPTTPATGESAEAFGGPVYDTPPNTTKR